MSHRQRILALVGLLGTAMATATYLTGALSVLSRYLVHDLDLSRSQLGFAFTSFSLTGAALAPMVGKLTDRHTRGVMTGLFVAGGLGMLAIAAAPDYPFLLIACAGSGLAVAAGNPVTNRVIYEWIPTDMRGLAVGLKQAGPPLALFGVGLVLPPVAIAFGWRAAVALSALVPLGGMLATRYLLPSDIGPDARTDSSGTRVLQHRAALGWLTSIGFGAAMGLGATIAFVPLYAQERIKMQAPTAGLLAALMGLAGVAGRVAWGWYGDRLRRPAVLLRWISTLAAASAAAIGLAVWAGGGLLWLGALVGGASMFAWHSLGWLTLIDLIGETGVGRASGIMQLGNGLGFAIGPLMAGILIDSTGSYGPAWIYVATLFVSVTLVTILKGTLLTPGH